MQNVPLPMYRFEDLKPGIVLPFVIEASSGNPSTAPLPPRSRLVEPNTEVDSGEDSGISTTLPRRKLPEWISLLYPTGNTDPAPIFYIKLKDSLDSPIECDECDECDDGEHHTQNTLTCLCEVIDPKERSGSYESSTNRRAVIRFGYSEALRKEWGIYAEHEIYGQLEEMQGTFMPNFLGRIRVPGTGTQAILLEYVETVPIASIIETRKQLTDVVESSFVFFARLIELNIVRKNWELENIAITASGQLVFFGFGRCHRLHPTQPEHDLFYFISELCMPLCFEDEKISTWQMMMSCKAIVHYLQCLEKKQDASSLTSAQQLELQTWTLKYRILDLTRDLQSSFVNGSRSTLYDAVCSGSAKN